MIKVVACGSLKERWLREGCQEYIKRLKKYDTFELVEVQDEKTSEKNSDAQNEQVKIIEGQRILKAIKDDEYVILLDLKGDPITSVQLATKMATLTLYGKPRITFVIGGSLGVSQEVIARANYRWKLSDLTFPHQLCRLILLEQIYRAFKIRRKEPYHK